MTLQSPGDAIIYRSKLNPKISRNFEIFTGPDFLATITQHIPDKGAQMVRYYGWYSNKMRGQRHIAQNGIPAEPLRPASTPPPPATLPSKKWRDVILKVWHTDPLLCPHCQHKMEVIAVIYQRVVIERILRHLGLSSGTPRLAASRAPPIEQTEHHSSPYDMSDPMPDYENVYTD